ncbi:cytochrome b5-related protein-like isoform X1 [Diabrotica virgifera virgifera]|uniref:Cytochrome b5 heme-binding domain-containing protein n=1 Tax=Diabrotica virgifera virgifera TaxID=50390 RepID=A0ABM5KLG9_DIAVI|nr:cytochrome b5-related protein-like isoform X1 [Diabrotica virgifera virgifera]
MDIVNGITSLIRPAFSLDVSMIEPSEELIPKSSLGIKVSSARLKRPMFLTSHVWMDERRQTDGAEGFWRIHDGLYDFTNFINQHPGGSDWLKLTKGTDISEAFETHHISEIPEKLIEKYFVKKAATKRNVPFTFKDDGFYRVLKREARKKLKDIPQSGYLISDFYSDLLLVGTLVFSSLAVRYSSFLFITVAGVMLSLLTIAAHNYIHRRDNFRMYYFQFSMFSVRDWRISHVLSHHLYTNTIIDLEISQAEPLLSYMPIKKFIGGYISVLLSPVIWCMAFPGYYLRRVLLSPLCNYESVAFTDLTYLILPAFMALTGGGTITQTLIIYALIMVMGSFVFTLIGLHAAHHHPDVFHDGDTPRAVENYDWGLSQLDAVMERKEIKGSDFLVLVSFGDHCMHHMFPTLDHSVLKHLYPTFEKVLKQFNENVRIVSQADAFYGGFQQLMKVEPNPSPPDLHKNKMFL